MKVILASGSLRRKELMQLLNIDYQVMVSDEDEVYNKDKSLYEQCLDISYHKALNVYNKTFGNRLIIGSDTIVIINNEIIGKPKDENDAFNILRKLSGRCHEVVTSLSILVYKDGKYSEEKTYSITKVYLSNMSDLEIEDWISNHNVCDKAGGYAIQEEFAKFIEKIDGDFYTVVGLPVNKLYYLLKKYL